MIDQGDRSLISQRKGTGVWLCRFVRRRTLCIRYKLDGHCGRPFFVVLGLAISSTFPGWLRLSYSSLRANLGVGSSQNPI